MLRSYKRINPESEKGKAKRLEFEAAERRILKAAGHKCQVKLDGICDGKAVTAHHLKLRSAGGGNDLSNLVAICRPCHRRVHNHPAEAAKAGNIRQRKASVNVSYAWSLPRASAPVEVGGEKGGAFSTPAAPVAVGEVAEGEGR
jgi:5-methylcytosine-specific restriction endonuclease McrA